MTNSRKKLALELISFLERGPVDGVNASNWKRTIRRLNQQHNQIRAWQIGGGESAPASLNGWRLLK